MKIINSVLVTYILIGICYINVSAEGYMNAAEREAATEKFADIASNKNGKRSNAEQVAAVTSLSDMILDEHRDKELNKNFDLLLKKIKNSGKDKYYDKLINLLKNEHGDWLTYRESSCLLDAALGVDYIETYHYSQLYDECMLDMTEDRLGFIQGISCLMNPARRCVEEE